MKFLQNKKGLGYDIIILMIVLFITAFCTILGVIMKTEFISWLNSTSNTTIEPAIKTKIINNTAFMNWGDYLFVITFIILLLAFLISSFTLPVQKPIFFFLFVGVLIFVCVLAMWLSNSWDYILQFPSMKSAAAELSFTSYVMKHLPIFVFITGIAGAIIFYSRKETSFETGGGGETSGIE